MKTCLDFAQPLDEGTPRLRHAFGSPRAVHVARDLDQVQPVLEAVHAAAERGAWCVGFVRYEAAPAFDSALQVHAADGPLAWFAEYAAPEPWPDTEPLPGQGAGPGGAPAAPAAAANVQWQHFVPRDAFDAAMQRIAQAIAAGEFYQVNYTARLQGTLQGDAGALFEALTRAQPGGYTAYLDTAGTVAEGAEQVLSVSPELFFDWQDAPGGGRILARPMKGTAARGATPHDDAAQAAHLRTSPKERAENVMIVDLLRNDLSRIAQPHSVQVPALFATQPLPTVWQMTSDVRARTRAGLRLPEVFGALFPCGSVTGAPKVRAMQMIRELETEPRGIYCGAIGVVRPAAASAGAGAVGAPGPYPVAATFNVPIRTVVLRRQGATVRAQCGLGSGVTSGADASSEWREWHHKRAFVERASEPFELLETLALQAGAFRHRDEHLARLRASAAHFGYPWPEPALQQALQRLVHAHPDGLWRVRLLLSAHGAVQAEAFALQPTPEPVRLECADRPMLQAHSEFTRYKTTRRAHYDAFVPRQSSSFDVVLYNTDGEITECTRGNVALLLDGRWVTPPLSCGLLPGVGREVALRAGRVSESVVHLRDLPRVQGWAFINSLRGWLSATLEQPAP